MDLLKIVTPWPHLIVNTDDVHTTYYACRLRVYASSVNDPLVYHTRPRRNKNKKKSTKELLKIVIIINPIRLIFLVFVFVLFTSVVVM